MFENLQNLVRENADDAIVRNPAIPNQHNEAAIQTTTESIVDTLKQHATGDQAQGLIDLFKGQGNVANGPLTGQVNQNVISSLMQKLGISNQVATSIATAIVPLVLSKLVSKTQDPNDSSFDLSSMMSSLGAGGLGNVLGGLFGGK